MGMRDEFREERDRQDAEDARIARARRNDPTDWGNWDGGMMAHSMHEKYHDYTPLENHTSPLNAFADHSLKVMHAVEQYPALYKAWQEIWPEITSPAAVLEGFSKVIERYEEPHRGYHTTEHLEEFLQHLILHKNKFRSTWPATLLAMFYHDAVYNAQPGEDEKSSVEIMYKDLMDAGLPIGSDTLRAEKLILFTINHKAPKKDISALLFLDADMAIVGSPPQRYTRYVDGFYKEYGVRYPPKELAFGRSAFLSGFLQKIENGTPIFKTAEFAHLETQARTNMQAELDTILKTFAALKAENPYP